MKNILIILGLIVLVLIAGQGAVLSSYMQIEVQVLDSGTDWYCARGKSDCNSGGDGRTCIYGDDSWDACYMEIEQNNVIGVSRKFSKTAGGCYWYNTGATVGGSQVKFCVARNGVNPKERFNAEFSKSAPQISIPKPVPEIVDDVVDDVKTSSTSVWSWIIGLFNEIEQWFMGLF